MELKSFLILNIPSCFLQVLFWSILLKPKYNKYLTFIAFFIPFTFLALMKATIPTLNYIISESSAIVYSVLYVLLMYKDKLRTKIYMIMLNYAVYISVQFVLLSVYSALGGDIMNPTIPITICDNMAFALVILIVYVIRKKTLFGMENSRFTVLGMSLMVISHIVVSFCVEALYSSNVLLMNKSFLGIPANSTKFYSLILCLICILLFLTDLLMFFVMKRASKSVAMQKDLELYEYKQSLYADYYAEVEANSQQTRKIRHDMANITEAIGAMLRSENADDKEIAKELYDKLQADIQNIRSYVYCSDNLLNAILTIKANICKDKDIEPDFAVTTDDFSKLDKTDLCKTVTNLLDNAIKSTEAASGKKKIVFRITADDNSLFISTVNPIGVNQPTPDDEKAHGYGLKILKDVAKKNNGKFTAEEKDGLFTTQMIIQI